MRQILMIMKGILISYTQICQRNGLQMDQSRLGMFVDDITLVNKPMYLQLEFHNSLLFGSK